MVCSTVVVVGALLTDSVWVVVVVVVGAGVSTVVQEVRVMAAIASSGVRIISFFIVGMFLPRTNRDTCFGQMYLERKFYTPRGEEFPVWSVGKESGGTINRPVLFSTSSVSIDAVFLPESALSIQPDAVCAGAGFFHGD